jgi:hypothetical protein
MAKMRYQVRKGVQTLMRLIRVFFIKPPSAEPLPTQAAPGHLTNVGCPLLEEIEWTEKYRTKDGSVDYTFSFGQRIDGTFHVYVVGPTEHLKVGNDVHIYMYEGKRRICWSNPIRRVEKAKHIAAKWAEAFERYRKDGTAF